MKSVITTIVCMVVAMMFAAPVYAIDKTKTVAPKCTAMKKTDAYSNCPGCHGHMGFDVYGKSSRHGHYVHDCSGCGDKPAACCTKNDRHDTAKN